MLHILVVEYLTGQRAVDSLSMTERHDFDGHLIVTHEETNLPLRILISGELKELISGLYARKESHKDVTAALLVNMQGRKLTLAVLRNHFDDAKRTAINAVPSMEKTIKEFWFYDLRAKAADDTSDMRGDQAASDLLGHESVKTTHRHYLRRGKIVSPTK